MPAKIFKGKSHSTEIIRRFKVIMNEINSYKIIYCTKSVSNY